MGFDKHFLGENMLAQKRYYRFFGNLETHTFGLESWQRRNISSAMEHFLLRMDLKYDSERIKG
jgi:hypothetical protein